MPNVPYMGAMGWAKEMLMGISMIDMIFAEFKHPSNVKNLTKEEQKKQHRYIDLDKDNPFVDEKMY